MLAINNLTYRVNGVSILKSINVSLAERCIYAFLGPNGAGKTSLIKCLLGLLKYQYGDIFIKSKPFTISDFKDIGVVFDIPSFYQNLSGIENLKIFAKYRNVEIKDYVSQLERVGLSTSYDKKVKNYSYGMKQRLSLAIALLHDPSFLIFDEPLNGLDPRGIKDLRNLLLWLNKDLKKTIFFSSHILSEVEQIATHIGIINDGEMKFEGTINNALNKSKWVKYILDTEQNDNALSLILKNINGSSGYLNKGDKIEILLHSNHQIMNEIDSVLTEKNIKILSLKKSNLSLEDFFFLKIGENENIV